MADCATVLEAMLARERGAALDPQVRDHLRTCGTCASSGARLDALDDAFDALVDDVAAVPPFATVAATAREAARGRRQVRFARRVLPLALAAAGAVGATVVATHLLHRPDNRVAVDGEVLDGTRSVAEATLLDGARVTVTAGRAVVEASGRLRAVVRLESGTAFVSVPRLAPGGAVIVTTDDAEVRVHGTRFDVAREALGTRVSVAEGTVEVLVRGQPGEAFLLAKGESRLIEGEKARRARARAVALASLEQRDDSSAVASIRAWLATDPPVEEAAEAHALLGWKLSRDGDRAGALQSYRRALELLPHGRVPLWADNACAQLALLEEGGGAAAGATAWSRYLDRFPGGVHAATARSRLSAGARGAHR